MTFWIWALAATLALRALATASPSNWLWGLNTFRHWPEPGPLLWIAAMLIGLAPPVVRRFDGLLEALGRAWGWAQYVGAAVVVLLVALLRDPIQFAGDHALRVGMLSMVIPTRQVFPQAYPLDVLLNLQAPRWLMSLGIAPELALGLVGAALAGAFAAISAAFVHALGARRAVLPAALAVLLGGGFMTHFAGYDKYGPLLVGVALVSLGVARLARSGGGVGFLAAGAAICVLAHRVGYAVIPTVGLALVMAWRAAGARRLRLVVAGLAVGAVAAAMLPFTFHILTSVDASVHLPGGAVARSLATGGAPDSLLHAADAVNLLFFLVPLWPLGVVAVLMRPRGTRPAAAAVRSDGGFPLAPVAVLGVASQLVWMFAIRASRGSGRDWDAYVSAAVPVAFVLTGLLIAAWQDGTARRSMAPVVWVAMVMAVASWWLHADARVALRRIETLMIAEPAWSSVARAHGHDHLGLWALNRREFDLAVRHFEAAVAAQPNPRYMHQAGLAHLHGGDNASAREAFARAARLSPTIADPWVGLAIVSVREGDSTLARARVDSALARDPRNADALELRRTLDGR